MHDILTRVLAMFVLSFVATFLLVGFGWLFRRRKIQEYQPANNDAEVAEEVVQSEPFRWYYVFFIIFVVLLALWLLPVLAGALLAICFMLAVYQYFRLRRSLARYLRRRGTRLPRVLSCVHAPCVALYRLLRYVRGQRHKTA
jgi:hypothetical protein